MRRPAPDRAVGAVRALFGLGLPVGLRHEHDDQVGRCATWPVRTAKFIMRKQWFICASDDMHLRVFNYNTMEKVKAFEAHTDYIRFLEIHPSKPFVISSSDDMSMKLWCVDRPPPHARGVPERARPARGERERAAHAERDGGACVPHDRRRARRRARARARGGRERPTAEPPRRASGDAQDWEKGLGVHHRLRGARALRDDVQVQPEGLEHLRVGVARPVHQGVGHRRRDAALLGSTGTSAA